jgi:hypothetical protein
MFAGGEKFVDAKAKPWHDGEMKADGGASSQAVALIS